MESRENNSSVAPLRFTQAAEAARQSFLLTKKKTNRDALEAFERTLAQTVPVTEYERGWCAAAGYAVRNTDADWMSPRLLPILMAHPDKGVLLSQLGLSGTVRINHRESTPMREFPLALVGGGSEQAVRMPPQSIAKTRVLLREVTLTFSDDEDGVIEDLPAKSLAPDAATPASAAVPKIPAESEAAEFDASNSNSHANFPGGESRGLEVEPAAPKKKRAPVRRPKRTAKTPAR
jgi:hypothetical protein